MDVDKLSYKYGTTREWVREMFGEFMGTFLLVFIGNCGVAQAVLSKGATGSFLSINLAYGIGATLGVLVSGGASGGHINPAVTLALAVIGKLEWIKVIHYFVGQYLGAFIAACFTYFVYSDALYNFDAGKREIMGDLATGGIFSTFPEEYVSQGILFLDQVMGTFVLMMVVCAITDRGNMEIHRSLYALYVGLLVAVLGMSLGLNHKYPINPARDFAPRVFLTIAGWGSAPFTYRSIFWIPIVGPHVGAILGALFYVFVIEIHLPELEI